MFASIYLHVCLGRCTYVTVSLCMYVRLCLSVGTPPQQTQQLGCRWLVVMPAPRSTSEEEKRRKNVHSKVISIIGKLFAFPFVPRLFLTSSSGWCVDTYLLMAGLAPASSPCLALIPSPCHRPVSFPWPALLPLAKHPTAFCYQHLREKQQCTYHYFHVVIIFQQYNLTNYTTLRMALTVCKSTRLLPWISRYKSE